jgi:hypothetical protein
MRLALAIDGCAEIIHSHQYKGWTQGDIEFEVEERPRKPHPDIADFLAANPLSPGTKNHPKYTLTGLIPDSSELIELKIRAAPTSYARTNPLQMHLRGHVFQTSSGQNETLLDRYGTRLFQFANCELPSILATQITCAIEGGEKLLLTQRTRHDGNDWYRGKWCCSIEEQMNGPPLPDTTQDRPIDKNLFDTVVRGVQEELFDENYYVSRDELRMLSIIIEGINLNVSAIAIVKLDVDLSEAINRWHSTRDGAAEILDFAEVPWTLESLSPVLFHQNLVVHGRTISRTEWHGATCMRILSMLYHKFGIRDTNEYLSRLSGR